MSKYDDDNMTNHSGVFSHDDDTDTDDDSMANKRYTIIWKLITVHKFATSK